MQDTKTVTKKVLNERTGKFSNITTGHCPYCKALMSYRNAKFSNCLCCGILIEWDTKH